MRLYMRADGLIVGTQAEAGPAKGRTQLDVPTDKAGLIDWLNNGPLAGSDEEQDEQFVPRDLLPEIVEPTPGEEVTLRVPVMPDMPTPAGRFRLQAGREQDQIIDHLLDEATPGFVIQNVLGACIERAERFKRLLG